MSLLKKCAVVAFAAAVLIGCGLVQVRADVITPTSADSSSALQGREAVNAINGSGLNGSGQHDRNYAAMWLGAVDTSPWISFALPGPTVLDGMHVWNYNGETAAFGDKGFYGSKDVAVYVSTDGVNYGATPVQSFVFTRAPWTDTYAGEDYSFTSPVTASAVKFVITSNHGMTLWPYAGLSEVRFSGTSTPEPSSMILMVTAMLGLLAYAWRKRK